MKNVVWRHRCSNSEVVCTDFKNFGIYQNIMKYKESYEKKTDFLGFLLDIADDNKISNSYKYPGPNSNFLIFWRKSSSEAQVYFENRGAPKAKWVLHI
ncbi:MAG: hypothetical protein GY795_11675 [Desulfobacterales bacterium]|nr:hypothetical protein [Desulfobacterales bacterium]